MRRPWIRREARSLVESRKMVLWVFGRQAGSAVIVPEPRKQSRRQYIYPAHVQLSFYPFCWFSVFTPFSVNCTQFFLLSKSSPNAPLTRLKRNNDDSVFEALVCACVCNLHRQYSGCEPHSSLLPSRPLSPLPSSSLSTPNAQRSALQSHVYIFGCVSAQHILFLAARLMQHSPTC